MTKLHYFCVTALLAASLFFLGTYLHKSKAGHYDLTYATAAATVAGSVSPSVENISKSPTLVSSSSSITEEKAVFLAVVACVGVCALVAVLTIREMKTNGKKEFQVPLIAASVMLAITFISTGIKYGML